MKIVPLSPPGMSETVLVSTIRHRKKFSFPFFIQLFEALCLDLGQLSYPHQLKEVVLSIAISLSFFFFPFSTQTCRRLEIQSGNTASQRAAWPQILTLNCCRRRNFHFIMSLMFSKKKFSNMTVNILSYIW